MYSSSFVVVVAILLVGARRSRGHIVREVEVVGHKLFPVGYSFTEGNETRVVSEISACAFVSDDEAVLVGDSGELFGARISEGLEIEFLWQKGLEIPGWEWVDAEGLAFTNDGRLFVSHEYHDKHSVGKSPLGVTQFNLTTGMAIDFGKMEYPTEGLPSNKGFEALAATSIFSPEKERLVTTAEDLDPHILLTFDVDEGVAREESAKYEASRLELSGTKLSVVEFASLLDQSLLVLERTFETYNTIRLFEYYNDSKRLVFEWNENGLNAANSASYPNLKVDNYEAMCLFPRQNQTTLLLVNDDNGNDSQIGTQFVAMRLFLEDSGEGEELSFPAPPTPAPTILRDSRKGETTLLWLIPMCVFTVIGVTACACGTRKPPVVIDEAGDQIELSHDVSNHRKAEGGADFTRVALDADDGLTPEPRDTQLRVLWVEKLPGRKEGRKRGEHTLMDTSWLVSCLWCNDDSSKANDEKKGFPSTVDDKRKRESPHVETSREEILHVLKKHMVARGTSILEIGSGTGQHCAYFAKELPRVTFQPSETTGYASPHFEATDVAVSLSSIDAWCEQLGNVKPALEIDASSKDQWPVKQKSFNALLAINLMHICTEDARRGLFQHASDVLLPSRGLIFIYGPFSTDQETSLSDSNKAFDTILRSKKSGKNKEQEMWGIQSVQQIDTIANHFEFERIALEAASPTYDNVTLVYAKCSH